MKSKVIFLLIGVSFFMVNLYSQPNTRVETTPSSASNFQWHKVSFEIKHYPHPDSNLVNQIPLKIYESQRLTHSNIEIFDPVSGYTIILYSDEKCRLNKSSNTNHTK